MSTPTHNAFSSGNIKRSEYSAFLVKKTEKLSSALYMVTNLISDTEPLKWKLRNCGVVLLSDISLLRAKTISERAWLLAKSADSITEILSLLAVATSGNLLSEMNASVLRKEYALLEDLIQQSSNMHNSLDDFMEGYFGDSPASPSELMSAQGQKGYDKRQYKGHNSVLYNNRYGEKKLAIGGRGPAHHHKKNSDKETRRKTIVDIVKKRKSISVKDISSVISDCSEKTLQRELTALVKDNVLKKEGERRWSKYSLSGQLPRA